MTMSAIGTKRKYRVCIAHVRYWGKRTCRFALHMSANDPKRTWPGLATAPFQCAGGGWSPLTRSNIFKHLHHLHFVILTSGLLAF